MKVNCINAAERPDKMKTEVYPLGLLTRRLMATSASWKGREKSQT